VGIASAVEGATIFAAVTVVVNPGRRDLIAPSVAIIVGLPFGRNFRCQGCALTAQSQGARHEHVRKTVEILGEGGWTVATALKHARIRPFMSKRVN
jgi:hypothetical protein